MELLRVGWVDRPRQPIGYGYEKDVLTARRQPIGHDGLPTSNNQSIQKNGSLLHDRSIPPLMQSDGFPLRGEPILRTTNYELWYESDEEDESGASTLTRLCQNNWCFLKWHNSAKRRLVPRA
jgi:hypothetical protein